MPGTLRVSEEEPSTGSSSTSFKTVSCKLSLDGAGAVSHLFDYDFFIAFDESDTEMVREHIINKLDLDFGGDFKCCFEHKNFIPGTFRAEAIVDFMDKSYRTLLVLSHAHLRTGNVELIWGQNFSTELKKRVVLVRLDNCRIMRHMDRFVWLDFQSHQPDAFHRRLKEIVLDCKNAVRTVEHQPTLPLEINSKEAAAFCPSLSDNQSVNYEGAINGHSGMSPLICTSILPVFEETKDLHVRVENDILSSNRLSDMDKWSAESFHNNATEYIANFRKTQSPCQLHRKIEKILMQDILTVKGSSANVSCVNLVELSCCSSFAVKERSLQLLKTCIIKDDLCSERCADGLKEAEELLRHSFCSTLFRNEILRHQILRIEVYGRILFYIAMHIERAHLNMFEITLRQHENISDIMQELLRNKYLKISWKYSLQMANEAVRYLRQLNKDLGQQVHVDLLWNKIHQHITVQNFENYMPRYLLSTALEKEANWYHMDIMMHYFCGMVDQNPYIMYVIIRNTHVLLENKQKLDSSCQLGVLLNVAKLLANIVINHGDQETRFLAWRADVKKAAGLLHICESEFYKKNLIFQHELQDILQPLLLSAEDDEVRCEIAYTFFIESKELKTRKTTKDIMKAENPILFPDKMTTTTEQHLHKMYENNGYVLEFKTQFGQFLMCDNYMTMCGHFAEKQVVVKMQRLHQLHDVLKIPTYRSSALKTLKNEVDKMSVLAHPHILKLICRPNFAVQPLHYVVESCGELGSLRNFLTHHREMKSLLSVHELLNFCLQVCLAGEYMSLRGMVHTDICTENVLLLKDGKGSYSCKLTGFSMAKTLSQDVQSQRCARGEDDDQILVRWSAPESYTENIYSSETDLWMFACFMFEVFTFGCDPFPECREADDVHQIIRNGHCLRQPACIPDEVFLVMLQCLSVDPQRRIVFEDLKNKLMCLRQTNRGELGCHDDQAYCLPQLPNMTMARRLEPYNEVVIEAMLSSEADLVTNERIYQNKINNTKLLEMPDTVDCHDYPTELSRATCLTNSLQVKTKVLVEEAERRNSRQDEDLRTKLLSIKHENVCRVFETPRLGSTYVQIISECPSSRNILEYILDSHDNVELMNTDILVGYMAQLCDAVTFLHSRNILHCDLKAEWVYVNLCENGPKVKLGRFARSQLLFSGMLEQEAASIKAKEVPLDAIRWAAPEVLLEPAFYTTASDVYSLSMVFWQMLYTLQVQYNQSSSCNTSLYRKIVPYPECPQDREVFHHNLLLGLHPPQPVYCPDWLYIALKKCWRERIKRPSLKLLQECMRSREPFESTLLKEFANMCRSNIYCNTSIDTVNLHFAQSTCASHVNYNTSSTTCKDYHPSFDERLEENIAFYANGAIFGEYDKMHSKLPSEPLTESYEMPPYCDVRDNESDNMYDAINHTEEQASTNIYDTCLDSDVKAASAISLPKRKTCPLPRVHTDEKQSTQLVKSSVTGDKSDLQRTENDLLTPNQATEENKTSDTEQYLMQENFNTHLEANATNVNYATLVFPGNNLSNDHDEGS